MNTIKIDIQDKHKNGQYLAGVTVTDGAGQRIARDVRLDVSHDRDAFASEVEMKFGAEAGGSIQNALKSTAESYSVREEEHYEPEFGQPIPLAPPPVPQFDDSILTGWAGDMVRSVADAMEVPSELPLAFLLAGLGIAGQGRFSVNPEPGYFEALAMYAACAMPSGSRKTGVMLAMMGWGYDLQRRKRIEFEPIIEQAKSDDAILRARIKALQSKAGTTKDETEAALIRQEIEKAEAEIKPIPNVPRHITEDCTPEKLAALMAQNNGRMGIVSDEGGVFEIVTGGRYSDAPNLDLILKAHTGSPVIQDRGSRDPVYLDHPYLSIGIAPQPSVIAELVSKKVNRQRGLPARFIIFLPQSRLGHRTLQGNPIPEHVANEFAKRMTALAEMDGEPDGEKGTRPRVLGLHRDAWREWKDFALEIEPMMAEGGELQGMTDWGGKLSGMTARIAGLLHLAEHGTDAIREREIAPNTMQRAVQLARFSIPHAKIAFESMDGTGDLEVARRLWREASNSRRRSERADPQFITARELWHPLRSSFKSTKGVEGGIRLLIDHNYLAEVHTAEIGKPGRPSRRFQINPALIQDWI